MYPGRRNDSACNVYILRRKEWPQYWPPNAQRITWPSNPTPRVYRNGMSPKAYWEALCKADAGEFVFRRTENTEGFLFVRPRGNETDTAAADPGVIEDAYGHLEFYGSNWLARPGTHFLRLSKDTYRYVESGTEGRWLRHAIDQRKFKSALGEAKARSKDAEFTILEETAAPVSKYGVSWRGIRRDRDLQLGISGGELVIFDLQTGEILALRRGYALDGYAARGIKNRHSWLSSWGCPVMARDPQSLRLFVSRVLQPVGVE